MKNKFPTRFPPLIFNVFKPAKMSSYDVVRHFKRNLPQGFGKIGHFGTLDPFASGVLMIGIAGAARLNELIHSYLPKTYLAVGKLGIETPTGDYTSEIIQRDESLYLKQEIAQFSATFIEQRLREKFLGVYWQAPHKYSAAKFQGRNLHEWAREGVDIKKEPVRREIFRLEVVRYQFPYLSMRVEVSSGTYVRTLFSDMCQYLGTLGSLIALSREKVGHVLARESLHYQDWPHERNEEVMAQALPVHDVLSFPTINLTPHQAERFLHGAFFRSQEFGCVTSEYVWMKDETGRLLGLSQLVESEVRPKINFGLMEQASP